MRAFQKVDAEFYEEDHHELSLNILKLREIQESLGNEWEDYIRKVSGENGVHHIALHNLEKKVGKIADSFVKVLGFGVVESEKKKRKN